jgi:hypothetical protein
LKERERKKEIREREREREREKGKGEKGERNTYDKLDPTEREKEGIPEIKNQRRETRQIR